MSKFKLNPESIVFLRGAQEEMFSKLLQLQLAPNPAEIIEWMFDHGVNRTLNSYGFSENEVKNIAEITKAEGIKKIPMLKISTEQFLFILFQ